MVRKLWTGEPVSHEGEHFSFPEVLLSPPPKQPIPIWCGGGSGAAMRRTAELCDGWLGLWYTAEQAVREVGKLRTLRAASARAGEPLDALVGLIGAPEPDTLVQLETAGITRIVVTPWQMENPAMAPVEAKRDALERYAARWLRR